MHECGPQSPQSTTAQPLASEEEHAELRHTLKRMSVSQISVINTERLREQGFDGELIAHVEQVRASAALMLRRAKFVSGDLAVHRSTRFQQHNPSPVVAQEAAEPSPRMQELTPWFQQQFGVQVRTEHDVSRQIGYATWDLRYMLGNSIPRVTQQNEYGNEDFERVLQGVENAVRKHAQGFLPSQHGKFLLSGRDAILSAAVEAAGWENEERERENAYAQFVFDGWYPHYCSESDTHHVDVGKLREKVNHNHDGRVVRYHDLLDTAYQAHRAQILEEVRPMSDDRMPMGVLERVAQTRFEAACEEAVREERDIGEQDIAVVIQCARAFVENDGNLTKDPQSPHFRGAQLARIDKLQRHVRDEQEFRHLRGGDQIAFYLLRKHAPQAFTAMNDGAQDAGLRRRVAEELGYRLSLYDRFADGRDMHAYMSHQATDVAKRMLSESGPVVVPMPADPIAENVSAGDGVLISDSSVAANGNTEQVIDDTGSSAAAAIEATPQDPPSVAEKHDGAATDPISNAAGGSAPQGDGDLTTTSKTDDPPHGTDAKGPHANGPDTKGSDEEEPEDDPPDPEEVRQEMYKSWAYQEFPDITGWGFDECVDWIANQHEKLTKSCVPQQKKLDQRQYAGKKSHLMSVAKTALERAVREYDPDSDGHHIQFFKGRIEAAIDQEIAANRRLS